MHRDIGLMRNVVRRQSIQLVVAVVATIALAGCYVGLPRTEGDGADRNLPILEVRPFRGVGGQFLDRRVERNIGQHQHGACRPTTTIRDTSRKLSMPDTVPWCSHSTLRGSGVLYFRRGGTEQ